jgi:hypothetical protein
MDWERRQDWRDALPASVINWQEAVEQCSGDEEFLVELIGDFQESLSQGLHSIDTALTPILTVRNVDHPQTIIFSSFLDFKLCNLICPFSCL